MPPITSAHNMLDGSSAAGGGIRGLRASRSAYTYLIPALAEDPMVGLFAGTSPQQTVDRLRAFEVATRVPFSDMPTLQMRLPAAYTYFGQFMNHDISAPVGDVMSQDRRPAPVGVVGTVDPPGLDRSRRASVAIILENLANEHPQPLTLTSLYGDGPQSEDPAIAALYQPDGKRFRLAVTRREPNQFFTDRQVDPARVMHATGAPDVPRAGGLPLIADCRNDENLIISQVHLALMLLHNKAVAALEPRFPDPAKCFREARALLTRHYHWLILNDYLPKLLSPSILVAPLAARPVRLPHANRVPLEFTTAAFRFGHSMVSAAYDFNANFGLHGRISGDGATLTELFAFTTKKNMGTADPQTLQLPDHWVIDWDRMTRLLPGTATTAPREFGSAERIDLNFAPEMLNLIGDSDVAVHGSILLRNLMRGFHRRIAFGQQLAKQYGIAPLAEAEVRAALPEEKHLPPGKKSLRQVAEDLGMLRETPAWLYFLCEAHQREKGERVGATASHIIADTVVGLIQLNPQSLLHHAGGTWHPRDSALTTPGAEGLTSIRKLLRFAMMDTAVLAVG
jgi:Animal haem peroxidase